MGLFTGAFLSRSFFIGAFLFLFSRIPGGIAGFLQWGYNFYATQLSDYQVNPYEVTDGEAFSPAGDCFQVYPGENELGSLAENGYIILAGATKIHTYNKDRIIED